MTEYNAFITRWKSFYPESIDKILYWNRIGIASFIRCNTLKISLENLTKRLYSRSVNIVPYPNINGAATVIKSGLSLGATHEYLKGFYTIQGLASQLPDLLIDFGNFEDSSKEKIRFLDMASSPGNKTCQIADILNNSGSIVAIERSDMRINKLIANISRLGVHNTIVLRGDALGWVPRLGLFTHILLDAPCSGSGSICRNPTTSWTRTVDDLPKYQDSQIKLLKTGLAALAPGGELVYSTCSIEPEENEEVIMKVLKTIPEQFRLVNLTTFQKTYNRRLDFGPILHNDLKEYAIRLLPSESHEGFFMVKFYHDTRN